jgi:hypothetical protein
MEFIKGTLVALYLIALLANVVTIINPEAYRESRRKMALRSDRAIVTEQLIGLFVNLAFLFVILKYL